MTGKLIAVFIKDYELTDDEGNKEIVRGDVCVGTTNSESDAEYFKGAFFSKYEEGYDFVGSITLTREEFDTKVESWREVKK